MTLENSLPLVINQSSTGLTLPVWVAAAAKAALRALLLEPFTPVQALKRPDAAEPLSVPVQSAARLSGDQALAISRCDPGVGLDLTRNLEVWVRVAWVAPAADRLELRAGEGLGTLGAGGELCLSAFARQLLEANLVPLLPPDRTLLVEPVLPRGRQLAERTSNAAFGVVDGLALIGTQAEVQRSADPDQLQQVLRALRGLAAEPSFDGSLVLVIGENGLDLAERSGLAPRLKVGNWMGPVLVAAAEIGVNDLLLFGYHGKLIKLAGGIFHTHHHLADGRLEVLTALAVDQGLPMAELQQIRSAASVEQAFQGLAPAVAERLGAALAAAVEQRSQAYIRRYGDWSMQIGAALFDRDRLIRWRGPVAVERFFTLMD